jgi:hypothetical protein
MNLKIFLEIQIFFKRIKKILFFFLFNFLGIFFINKKKRKTYRKLLKESQKLFKGKIYKKKI